MGKTICVVIGHGPNDSGAVNGKDNEFEFNSNFAEILTKKLSKEYEVIKYNRGTLKSENISILNSYEADVILSLHCNSADNKQATGTEIIHHEKSKNGKMLATILSQEISNALGLKNRGAKPPFNGRGNSLLSKTKPTCVILEPFFISNDNDLKIAKGKLNEYAEAIANGLKKYFEEIKK